MSYNGEMNFGLLGDYDALPDIDAVAEGIEASLAELVTLAREAGRRGGGRRRVQAGLEARRRPGARLAHGGQR